GGDPVIRPPGRNRDDLMRFMAIRPERIQVIPMGVGAPFAAAPGDAPKSTARADARDPEVPSGEAAGGATRPAFRPFAPLREAGSPVLIYAGGFNPTKNVAFLIEALAAMGRGGGGAAPVLCLAGAS